MTWAIFGGDFGIDLTTSLIPGSIVVTTSSLVSNWVLDTPPGDLRVKIEVTLLRIGIQQENVDRLLRHRSYPLSYLAALTTELEVLKKVSGYEKVVPLALSVETFDQACFVVNSVRMLRQYHETIEPLQSIDVQSTVFATNTSGTVVVAAPVDCISWSEMLDRFSGQEKFISRKHEQHIAGTMSEMAREHLKMRKWSIYETSNLFTTVMCVN